MMKHFALVLGFAAVCLCTACSDDSDPVAPTTTEEDATSDIVVGSDNLDFGTTETVRQLAISVADGKQVEWKLRKSRSWLSLDVEEGVGSKTVTVTIDRGQMPLGLSQDTIVLTATRIKGEADKGGTVQQEILGSRRIPVTAEQLPSSWQEALQSLQNSIDAGVQLPPIDTTASFMGSFEVRTVTTTRTAFGAFYSNGKFFTDAGSMTAYCRADTSKNPNESIAMERKSYSYANPHSGATETGYYYVPDAEPKPFPWAFNFDGTTYHRFQVSGGPGGFPAVHDSVLSVVMPTMSSPADGAAVSKHSDLTITWSPSADGGDKVFVVIVSGSADSTRITGNVVDDATGSLTIPASNMGKLSNGVAKVFLARFRIANTAVNGTKAAVLSQSQRLYTLTIGN